MKKQSYCFMSAFLLCCYSITLNAEDPSRIIRLNERMSIVGKEKICRGIGECFYELQKSLKIKNTAYALIKPTKDLCVPFGKSTNYSTSTSSKTGDYIIFATDENHNWIASSEKGCINMHDCMHSICKRMNFLKAAWAGIFDAAHKR